MGNANVAFQRGNKRVDGHNTNRNWKSICFENRKAAWKFLGLALEGRQGWVEVANCPERRDRSRVGGRETS